MVAKRVLQRFGRLVQVREQFIDTHLCEMLVIRVAAERGQSGVELVGVGLVMLQVMDLHRASVDVRLERVVVVAQGRQREILAQHEGGEGQHRLVGVNGAMPDARIDGVLIGR